MSAGARTLGLAVSFVVLLSVLLTGLAWIVLQAYAQLPS